MDEKIKKIYFIIGASVLLLLGISLSIYDVIRLIFYSGNLSTNFFLGVVLIIQALQIISGTIPRGVGVSGG